MRSLVMFIVLMIAMCTLVCEVAAEKPEKVEEKVASVAESNNGFAFDMYARLAAEVAQKDGNLFFSPSSIVTALAMTYGGARGETAAEMKKVLHFQLDDKELHPAMGKLAKALTYKEKGLKLSIANALWGQEDYKFLDSFLDLNKKSYEAGLKNVDFKKATEETRKLINKWVEQKTNDKIKDLIKPGVLDAATKLVLTNAIHFKGTWKVKFDKKDTKKEKFHVTDEKSVQIDTMKMKKPNLKYLRGDGFKALELPYEGGKMSMVLFLPDKVDGLAQFEKSFTLENVKKWLPRMWEQKIQEVAIPKFTMTREFSLNKVLAEMGMPTAFVYPKADFSGMDGSRELYISGVIHKAFVDVYEEGTEAAAATAVVMRAGSARPPEPKIFKADHPFAFVIRDVKTGTILFMGRVTDPTKK